MNLAIPSLTVHSPRWEEGKPSLTNEVSKLRFLSKEVGLWIDLWAKEKVETNTKKGIQEALAIGD